MHMASGIFDEAICNILQKKGRQVFSEINVICPTLHATLAIDYWKVIVVCELTIKSNLRLATFFCHNIPGALTPICQIIPLPNEEKRITFLLTHGGRNTTNKINSLEY